MNRPYFGGNRRVLTRDIHDMREATAWKADLSDDPAIAVLQQEILVLKVKLQDALEGVMDWIDYADAREAEEDSGEAYADAERRAHKETAEAVLWAMAEIDGAMCAAMAGETGPRVAWGEIAAERLTDRCFLVLSGDEVKTSVPMGMSTPVDYPGVEFPG